MTGPGSEAFISLDPDGRRRAGLVAPSMINKSTPSRLPKSTSWSISAAVDNSVCCGSPAVIQDSAEAARLGSGSQTDSDRMTLWSG